MAWYSSCRSVAGLSCSKFEASLLLLLSLMLLTLMACYCCVVGIAEYLKSDKRPSNFWGSEWLTQRGGKGWGQGKEMSGVNIPAVLAALTLAVAFIKSA